MESDQDFYHYSLIFFYLLAPLSFVILQFLQAPHGRHHRPGRVRTIPAPLAWLVMESPTLWLTLLLFPLGIHSSNPKSLALISPFLIHYFHRTCIYSAGLKSASGFPVPVAFMGFGYHLLNTYLQARSVSHYSDYGGDEWFWWRFWGGAVVFLAGMVVNVWSDRVLVRLKNEAKGGYKVPRGGLFEMVSCPNYLGECVEWLGWAFMTWSWAGLGFFLHICAHLVPRARANHKWCLDKFGEDYPKTRKAIIPFLY